MLKRLLRFTVCGALGFFVSAALVPQSTAEPASSGDKTLRELLDEVRLLRRVLQESSVGSLRAQILLTQRQGHDERAVQIDRQLAGMRSTRNDMGNQIARMNGQISEFERVLTAESDPEKRSAYEAQIRVMVLERDQLQQNQQKSFEREQELEAQVSRETAEVERIQKELDRIESDLAAIQKSRPRSEAN